MPCETTRSQIQVCDVRKSITSLSQFPFTVCVQRETLWIAFLSTHKTVKFRPTYSLRFKTCYAAGPGNCYKHPRSKLQSPRYSGPRNWESGRKIKGRKQPPSPTPRACILACLLNLRVVLTIREPAAGYKRPGRDLMSEIGNRPMRTAIKQARCSWATLYFKLFSVLMRDVSNDSAPPSINGMFTLSRQVHNYNTWCPSVGNVRLEGRYSSYHPFKVQCPGNYLAYRDH